MTNQSSNNLIRNPLTDKEELFRTFHKKMPIFRWSQKFQELIHPISLQVSIATFVLYPSKQRVAIPLFALLSVRNKIWHSRNRKPHFLLNKKHGDAISEIFDTYFPQGGIVMDLFYGTMTTGTGCIPSKRGFILIEKDPFRFKTAEHSWRRMAGNMLASRSSMDTDPTTRRIMESE